MNTRPDSEIHVLSDAEMDTITELVNDKYSRWKWNIGYSPKYRLTREWTVGVVPIKATLGVEKGRIVDCRIAAAEVDPGVSGADSAVTPTDPGAIAAADAAIKAILGENIPGLDSLADNLVGMEHDPDRLKRMISEKEIVNPEWIDIFVKGLF
jgi:hypothetical protein